MGWTQARAQIRTWTNRGDHGRADMAKLVAQGGIWTRSRLRDDGHPVEGVCPRCLNAEETALHFFWERPSNATCPHIDVQSTQYLILLAAASAVDDPGLWLRGLVARTKTFGIVAAPDDELALHNWGCFAGPLPFALPGPAVGAADGSGASAAECSTQTCWLCLRSLFVLRQFLGSLQLAVAWPYSDRAPRRAFQLGLVD